MIVSEEEFEPIFLEIKEKYLSNTNFPKLIIGTGLSISMGVPGMRKLAEKIENEFNKEENISFKDTWEKYRLKIKEEGLEQALLDISENEEIFLEKIKEITSEFILEEEYTRHKEILNTKSGFEKFLKYLSNTVSVNNSIIDIMTPNYDRIIELISDKLGIATTLGFTGNLIQTFNEEILKTPYKYFNKKNTVVRIFKPHGSINWIKKDNRQYQSNDYKLLKKEKKFIDIITPGGMKYKLGMINKIFRIHREIFNSLVSDSKQNYSIFIYGYGFNDQHLNNVFETIDRDILVLTKTIKRSIFEKAINNKNWTIFYKSVEEEEESSKKIKSYMIFKGKKYELNKEIWNIDIFVDVFLG